MKVVPNPAGIRAAARSPQMLEFLLAKAEAAAVAAKSIAPVGATGNYRDSIHGDAGIENGVPVGRVTADDWKAGLLEFGTFRTPAFATLRRGAESVGLIVRSNE